MTLDEYFMKPFVPGARGPDAFDCWGWVRAVRHDVYGKQLMPEFPGVTKKQPGEMHRFFRSILNDEDYRIFDDVDSLTPGTVVAVLRGGMCDHIGMIIEVNGTLYYADTSSTGTRRMTIDNMLRHYSGNYYRLVFGDDHS